MSPSMIWRWRIIHIIAGRDFIGSQLVTILVFESYVQGDDLGSFLFSYMFLCSSLIVFLLFLFQCRKRRLRVAVVGVPKTIDNDILLMDKTFGFDTAVEEAQRAINSAYIEVE